MSRFDDALELLDLHSWLEQYAETRTTSRGEITLKECPKCGDDRYKLYANEEKKLFNCYFCQWGHGIFDICVLMAGVSGRHINDIKLEVASMTVPSVPDDEFEDLLAKHFDIFAGKPAPVKDYDLEPVLLPGDPSFEGITAARVRKYAIDRGMTDSLIDRYKLRCAVKLRNKFPGPFLVFPIYYQGIPVGWQGRKIKGKKEPKYVSSDSIASWLWPMDQFIHSKKVILTEGVFDAMGFHHMLLPALCTFGKKITNEQVRLLKVFGVTTIYLAWDFDAAREIQKTAERLAHMFDVWVVPLVSDEKYDPGDVLKEPEQLEDWLRECYEDAMNVHSDEYDAWKLETMFEGI